MGWPPPHTYAFSGFLAGLVKSHGNDVGKVNREQLEALKTKTDEMSWQELAELVKVFKVSKVFEKENRRITLMLEPGMKEERKALKNSLEQLGGQHKVGKAPPSHMERELQAYLDSLE